MAEARVDRLARVLNWTIHNFSCWNGDVHCPVLKVIDVLCVKKIELTIDLYPRGVSGREQQLVVQLCVECKKTFKGDLSFIASDGSLLYTRQFSDIEFCEGVLELPPGPKFRDVVQHITKKKVLHKDQLTLRLRIRHTEGETIQTHINSMIQTFETTLKIHLEELKGWKQFEDFKGGYGMEYSLNDSEMINMAFLIKDSETAAETIEMILKLETAKNKFAVRILMSLLNSDGSVLRSEQNEHVFRDEEDWVISNSLTKEEASQKGYSVVIDFKIIPSNGHKLLSYHFSRPVNAFEVKPTKTCFHQTPDVLKTDLMCLYQDQDFSDLQLKCDNVTIPVHKNILSARSPVFKAMLSTDMAEAASSEVDIGDLDPSTLGLFLTYLYTGAVEQDLQSDRALKLYYAVDKYQVPSLKRVCADFLRDNASIDNVCDILSLAHKHEDDQLLSVSHTLILNNYNEVLASEQWGSFMRSEPLLALETFTQFAKNKSVRGNE